MQVDVKNRPGLSMLAVAAISMIFALSGCKGDKGDNGSEGPQGQPGPTGPSCVAADKGDGTATITCPDGTVITVKNGTNGTDGQSCSVVDNGDGTKTITCGTNSVTVANGTDGTNGTNGTDGTNGNNGTNAVDHATINGTVTATSCDTSTPPVCVSQGAAAGLAVTTVPDSGVTATTDATGAFTMSLPLGMYAIHLEGAGYTTKDLPAFSVVAGSTVTVTAVVSAVNPLKVVGPVYTAPAGFDTDTTVKVTVTGGTAPYTYAWTKKTTNPTDVTLATATTDTVGFRTGTLTAIIASGKVIGIERDLLREGLVGITAQQLTQMSYAFDCKVTDDKGFIKVLTVTVPPATLAPALTNAPRNQIVIVSQPANTATLTLTKPSASGATLMGAATATPYFYPDVAGAYQVGNVKVMAADYVSTNSECGGCHTTGGTIDLNNRGKFKQWANSAHGNHFFKYMEYDANGVLVWKKDAAGKPIPAPTADPAIFWTEPGAMTTFEFGMTGAEGSHYSASCAGCHTTGNNALAANNGFDDVAATKGWTFPDLKAAFGGDGTTKAPVMTAWSAIPAEVKAYQGMQCEACHGPLGKHTTGSANVAQLKGEFDVNNCAQCHDKPTHHDRVALWRQSLHSDTQLALDESTVEGRGVNTSCYRCHSAQGFVSYLGTKETLVTGLVRPNNASGSPMTDTEFTAYLSGLGLNNKDVQPITCQACHDPHATTLRIEGDTGLLPNGNQTGVTSQVKGAGSGAICMVCHNTRNGARGDYVTVTSVGAPHAPVQTDLMQGANAYFMGAGGNPSKHLAVKNTCVGCHVEIKPEGVAASNTNHTFNTNGTICKECHAEGVNMEALEGQFFVTRAKVEAALATAFGNAVGGATPSYYVKAIDATTSATALSGQMTATPTSITFASVHGQPKLVLHFAAPVADPFSTTGGTTDTIAVGITDVGTGVDTGAGNVTGKLFTATGVVAKTAWNYNLVSSVSANPAANVIHNPTFVFDVLNATVAKLMTAAPSEL